MRATISYRTSIYAAGYSNRPTGVPSVTAEVGNYAEAKALARMAFGAAHGVAPTDDVTSDYNGTVTVEAYGPGGSPCVAVSYR